MYPDKQFSPTRTTTFDPFGDSNSWTQASNNAIESNNHKNSNNWALFDDG